MQSGWWSSEATRFPEQASSRTACGKAGRCWARADRPRRTRFSCLIAGNGHRKNCPAFASPNLISISTRLNCSTRPPNSVRPTWSTSPRKAWLPKAGSIRTIGIRPMWWPTSACTTDSGKCRISKNTSTSRLPRSMAAVPEMSGRTLLSIRARLMPPPGPRATCTCRPSSANTIFQPSSPAQPMSSVRGSSSTALSRAHFSSSRWVKSSNFMVADTRCARSSISTMSRTEHCGPHCMGNRATCFIFPPSGPSPSATSSRSCATKPA